MVNKSVPSLTVVVPIYNVEQYLEQCLDSLLYQTVRNHKVILVDDGSKDSSGEIADRYVNKYPELFTVIHKQNAGLGAARNTAMPYVTTPYVTFLDSDDWFRPNYVEIFTERLKIYSEAPDIIFTLPIKYDHVRCLTEPWQHKETFDQIFTSPLTVVNTTTDERLYDLEVNACRRIFRTSFLKEHNFSFPEGTYWEDVLPHFYLLNRAQRCMGIAEIGFMYRINTPSQITAKVGTSRLQVVSVFASTLAFAIEDDWDENDIAHIITAMLNFTHWSLDFTTSDVRKTFVGKLHILYKSIPYKYFKAYYEKYNIGRKQKLFVFALRSSLFNKFLKDHVNTKYAKAKLRKLRRGR